MTFDRQHSHYKELCEHLPKSANVLEIGCAFGKSTWAWLDVLPDHTNFYVLDAFVMPTLYTPSQSRMDTLRFSRVFARPRSYLKKYFNKDQRTLFPYIINQHPRSSLLKNIFDSTFQDWKKTNDLDFDLVYIDGEHSYAEVSSQLEYFSKSKCICGDDFLWPGVSRAVNEYVRIHNAKLKLYQEFFVIYN